MLARLLADPGCAVMRPQPLSADGAATIIAGRLLRSPEPRFLAACHRATGGNPYFVRQLAAALEHDDVAPTDDHASRVADLSPPDVSRAILTRLSPGARRLAQALAVLDVPSEASTAAAVAGLDADVIMAASAELTRAGVITDERPLQFEHPIVHAALIGSLDDFRPGGVARRRGPRAPAARRWAGTHCNPRARVRTGQRSGGVRHVA